MKITYAIIACYPDRGMKSYGSKSLITFGKRKLIEYQLDIIKKNTIDDYEIIVISNFDTVKLDKLFGSTSIRIIPLKKYNPIQLACREANYDNIIFIDYGCLVNYKVLKKLAGRSCVVCTNTNSLLDIGCIINDTKVDHMFFDLPDHKFCKIFALSPKDKNLVTNDTYNFNLLPFEIINRLILRGSTFNFDIVKSEEFIYFTHMRQKSDVNKFIKKIFN